MPKYIRPHLTGTSWFFTVNLFNRQSDLLTANINILRESVSKVRRRFPFHIDAVVVLPEHIHTIWTLPAGDGDFPMRWRLIKSHFTKAIPKTDIPSPSRKRRGERAIWQRRFWEHALRDDGDYNRHVEYCYVNPVKHGLVKGVKDWPYSSFHRDVQVGLFPEDWAGEWDDDIEYGER